MTADLAQQQIAAELAHLPCGDHAQNFLRAAYIAERLDALAAGGPDGDRPEAALFRAKDRTRRLYPFARLAVGPQFPADNAHRTPVLGAAQPV